MNFHLLEKSSYYLYFFNSQLWLFSLFTMLDISGYIPENGRLGVVCIRSVTIDELNNKAMKNSYLNVLKSFSVFVFVLTLFPAIYSCDNGGSTQEETSASDVDVDEDLIFESPKKISMSVNPENARVTLSVNGIPAIVDSSSSKALIKPAQYFKKGKNTLSFHFSKLNRDTGGDSTIDIQIAEFRSKKLRLDKQFLLDKSKETHKIDVYFKSASEHVWADANRINELTEDDRQHCDRVFQEHCTAIKQQNIEKLLELGRFQFQEASQVWSITRDEIVKKTKKRWENIFAKSDVTVQCRDINDIAIELFPRSVALIHKVRKPEEDYLISVNSQSEKSSMSYQIPKMIFIKTQGEWKLLETR